MVFNLVLIALEWAIMTLFLDLTEFLYRVFNLNKTSVSLIYFNLLVSCLVILLLGYFSDLSNVLIFSEVFAAEGDTPNKTTVSEQDSLISISNNKLGVSTTITMGVVAGELKGIENAKNTLSESNSSKNSDSLSSMENNNLINSLQEFSQNHPRVDVPEYLHNTDNPAPNLPDDISYSSFFDGNMFQSILENDFGFYQYAGLAVFFNTLWILLIFCVFLINNYLSKKITSVKTDSKFKLFFLKYYSAFLNIENSILMILLLVPVFSLFWISYLLLSN